MSVSVCVCVCACVCVCSQGGGGEGLSAASVCTDAVRGHTLLDGLEHTLHPRLPQTHGREQPRDPHQHLLTHGHTRLQPDAAAAG